MTKSNNGANSQIIDFLLMKNQTQAILRNTLLSDWIKDDNSKGFSREEKDFLATEMLKSVQRNIGIDLTKADIVLLTSYK